MRISPAVLGLAILAASCGPPPPRSVGERTVTDRERGCRYVAPERWLSFDGEMQSLDRSNFSIHVYSLAGADPEFVRRLPQSLYPQVEEWTRYYFIAEGPPSRTWTTVGGLKAMEISYKIRVRKDSDLTGCTYWIIRRGDRVHVLRAVYGEEKREKDEKAVRAMVAGWEFIEPNTGAGAPSPQALPSPSPGA